MKKEIGISALTAIITGLLILGGISLQDDSVHYCADKQIVMQCDKLSKYYSLDNGKCWNSKVGNKLCRSGWMKVTGEVELIKLKQNVQSGIPNSKQYLCGQTSCQVIN